MVGPLQPHPGGVILLRRQPLALGADIELFAPVALAPRMLPADPGIATEMRRIDHFDSGLLSLGQVEETPRQGKKPVEEFLLDAMADQIEESRVARSHAQLFQKGRLLCRPTVEFAEIEDGKRLRFHRCIHDLISLAFGHSSGWQQV